MNSMRKNIASMALALVATISVVGASAAPAFASTQSVSIIAASHISARGGGGGGSSSGGRGVQAPSNSGGSRVQSGTGAKAPSGSSAGRNAQAPSNSSGRAMPLTSSSVVRNAPTTRVNVPATARASGSSYSYAGHSYSYSQASYHNYYTTYHGGYPLMGTVAYWTLFNSPYYAPNYSLFGNPWYHHAYPVGYNLSSGEFVPVAQVSTGPSAGTIFLWIFLILLAAAAVYGLIMYFGRKKSPSYGGRI